MQAPIGVCDGPRLAAAVSRAGGLGTLSTRNPDAGALRRQLLRIRAVTPRPVVLALTAEWDRDAVLDTAFALGFPIIHVFWWNGSRLAPRVKKAGGTVFWQVGTIGQAREAVESGADVLVAQGTEAGGQVRSPHPILDLVRELRAGFGAALPILAGGGFADATDTRAALAAGADAAVFGTRFLLSEESNAAPRDKSRLLRARLEHLTLDLRQRGYWPCSPRRRLMTHSDEDNASLFAGLGIGRMRSLLPAAELVRALTP